MLGAYGAQAALPLPAQSPITAHRRHYKRPADTGSFTQHGDGTFRDVSKEWGFAIRSGKGWAWHADYIDATATGPLCARTTPNTTFCFHNLGNKFEGGRGSTPRCARMPEGGQFMSGMGLDFSDFNNDGYPDIAFVGSITRPFRCFRTPGKGDSAR